MSYASGDYYVICDRCSRKVLRSQAVKDTNQGALTKSTLMVCKEHFDGIHSDSYPRIHINDPRPLNGKLIRVDNQTFRKPSIWQIINVKWEDMNYRWEELNQDNTYDTLKQTLSRR